MRAEANQRPIIRACTSSGMLLHVDGQTAWKNLSSQPTPTAPTYDQRGKDSGLKGAARRPEWPIVRLGRSPYDLQEINALVSLENQWHGFIRALRTSQMGLRMAAMIAGFPCAVLIGRCMVRLRKMPGRSHVHHFVCQQISRRFDPIAPQRRGD